MIDAALIQKMEDPLQNKDYELVERLGRSVRRLAGGLVSLARYHEILACALISLGKPGEAEIEAERSFNIGPSVRAYSALGKAIWRKGDVGKQLELITKALELDKSQSFLEYYKAGRAEILLTLGRYEEGWTEFDSRLKWRLIDRVDTCPMWQGESLAGKRKI